MLRPEIIRDARKAADLTQQQLAKKAAVSQSLVAKLERGLLKPSYDVMVRLDAVIMAERREHALVAWDFVKQRPLCVSASARLPEVIELMSKHQYSQFPVIDGELVVGLVSEQEVFSGLRAGKKYAKELMRPAPPLIAADAPEDLIMALLDHTPIVLVQRNGKLAGAVTKSDIFRVYREKKRL